jgi:outer membrane protein assembly factor BamB
MMGRQRNLLAFAAGLLALSVAGPVAAGEPRKVTLPGETTQALSRLRLADELAGKQKWAEAIDEYQRLIQEAGDALVPADQKKDAPVASRRSVQVRRLCHARLAGLPPRGLQVYRRRVDLQAKRWLDEGIKDHDPRPLRRVIDEAFCSRPGEQALDTLGDLAFERGHFAEARRWWRLLALPASEAGEEKRLRPGELRFPDPTVDLTHTRAKQVLAVIFQGDLTAAQEELDAFRGLYPKATGHLAGRDGNLAEILGDWLRRPPAFSENEQWPTFAGSASRNRVLPAVPPRRLWADGPAWRVRLDTGKVLDPDSPVPEAEPPSPALAQRLLYYPIIVDRQVLVADAGRILAFDLGSGRPVFHYELPGGAGKAGNAVRRSCTLTAADGRIYAVLSPGPARGSKGSVESFLVCLELHAADGKRERWRIQAGDKADQAAHFEGAPVVRSGQVYAAVSRPADGQTRTAIACFDAATGHRRWQRAVCEVPEPAEPRPHLLTLAGSQLVYCSDAGAVVALDAMTGKTNWGIRYPGRPFSVTGGAPSPRDLAPPVYADGRLFVAPADTNRLFCLDPETGRTLWERDGIEVVHLLGVSEGRLVFTTPDGIRAVGARTGDDRDGWLQPEDGRLRACGRGLLAGGWVFWPVQDGQLPLRALEVASGEQQGKTAAYEPTQLRRIRAGNMAWGNHCLVVAGADELVGYVQPDDGTGKDKKAPPGAQVRGVGPARGELAKGLRHPLADRADRLSPRLTTETTPTPPAPLAPPLAKAWEAPSGWPSSLVGESPASERATGCCTVREDHLLCHDLESGALRWERQLSIKPCWLGWCGAAVVAAGPAGAQCVGLADGRVKWLRKSEKGPLSEFRFAGTRFCFLEDRRCVVALNHAEGHAAWVTWAPSARLFPEGGGRFQPSYYAGRKWILLQTTGGHRVLLDGHNGRQVSTGPTGADPWPQPPVAITLDCICIVEARGKVLCLDATAGKEVWTWKPRWPTTLSGEPPCLFGDRDALFLVVSRNLGYELERLNPQTGVHVWPAPVGLGEGALNPEAVVADKKAVYFAQGGTMSARVLADGKLLWRRPLGMTAPRWQLARAGKCLIAWPLEMDWGLHWGWLPAGDLAVAFPLRAPLGQRFPLVLSDPANGKVLQRLDFPTAVPQGTVQLFPGRLIVGVPGRLWGLQAQARE